MLAADIARDASLQGLTIQVDLILTALHAVFIRPALAWILMAFVLEDALLQGGFGRQFLATVLDAGVVGVDLRKRGHSHTDVPGA